MNQLSTAERVAILTCLSEGMGVNATCRVTGKAKNTVLKLISDVGEACAAYQDRVMRKLTCKRVECDEIWSFIGAKEAHLREDHPEEFGDCYTFTALDPDTKLMPCWLVGVRNTRCTEDFMADLASRMAGRIQLTTDGWNAYPQAVEKAFGRNVDYGVLDKSYSLPKPQKEAARRYTPNQVVKTTKMVVNGAPDLSKISTSLIERTNLSLRMSNRRFTRLANGFSRKMENHMAAVSFYFMVYNFVKIHSSIKTTPAMEAGVTDFLWTIEDVVTMADTNS